MIDVNRGSRMLAMATVGALTSGFLAFIPLALAAPVIDFSVPPADEFKVYEEGDYEVAVDASNIAEDTTVDFYVRGPLGKDSEEDHLISSYQYIQASTYEFIWDGLFDGGLAEAGDYELRLEGSDLFDENTNVLKHQFTVIPKLLPELSFVGNLPTQYDPSLGADMKVTVEASNIQEDTLVDFYLRGPVGETGEQKLMIISYKYTQSTVHGFTWNGIMGAEKAVPGTYELQFMGKDLFGVETNLLTHQFTVLGEEPQQKETQCADFTDVEASNPDCVAIQFVKSIGAMTGHPDGTFGPDEFLQRDQVAKISLETFQLFDESEDYCGGEPAFPDVPESQWSFQYICRGVELNMITGYQSGPDTGNYVPGRSVNRVEFLALILRNLNEDMPGNDSESYADVEAGTWYSGYAKFALDNGLFEGENLNPSQEVSRLEVAQVLSKLNTLDKL